VQQLLYSGEHTQSGVEDGLYLARWLGKVTKTYFAKFLRLEQCCCVLNLIAMGISVMEYDLEFQERDEEVPNTQI
jgi:potassium intermediate/small conductance calcium-activated channel subfamily N protein 2